MTSANLSGAIMAFCHTGGEMSKIKTKWDKLDERVQKWATRLGAIATIVGVLVAGGGWLINQVDNAVATRIENQTASIQTEVQKLTDKLDSHENQSELSYTRLELMMLMSTDPTNTVEIERLAHRYFSELKGNSYMVSEYNHWCHTYSGNCEIIFK